MDERVPNGRRQQKWIVTSVSVEPLRLMSSDLFGNRNWRSRRLTNRGCQHSSFISSMTNGFLEKSALDRRLVLQKETNTTIRNGASLDRDVDDLAGTIGVAHRDLY